MFVPIVSMVYRSTTADTFELARTCSHCNQTSPARVSAYSVGEAESFIPLQNAGRNARERSLAGLRPAAETSLALAACPHCNTREPAAVRTVRRAAISASLLTSRALVPLVLAAFTLLIGVMVIVMDHLYVDGAITLAVGLAFVAAAWLLARIGLRKRIAHAYEMADATVMWIGHEKPEPLLEMPPRAMAPRADNGWPFA